MLSMPLSSCCRYHPARVKGRINQFSTLHAAFIPRLRIRPLELTFSGPPVRSLSLRPDDSLTIPTMALSMGFRYLVSLLPAIQTTGLLVFTPAGLTPAEHTSLTWTHNRACEFPSTRLKHSKGQSLLEDPAVSFTHNNTVSAFEAQSSFLKYS